MNKKEFQQHCARVDRATIEALEKENAELKAHVSELRGFVVMIGQHCYMNDVFVDSVSSKHKELLARTPEQSLAEIQAKAVEDALETVFGDPRSLCCDAMEYRQEFEDYIANKLRSKAK